MPKPNVRDKLLTSGLDTVHRLGFNGCSVQDITQAASVPKGSFYNHFESKEAFGVAILELYWQNLADQSLQILNDPALSPIQRLQQFFDALTQDLAAHNYENGCLFGNLGAEVTNHSDLVRDRLSSLIANWTHAIARCVQAAQQQGELRSDLEAHTLAAFLINAWEGAVLRSKIDRSAAPLQQFNQVVFLTLIS
ncbi:MAG TPA: TetR family transcriptional regulator C-terminal domain-containing protein [Leptolyngbyaceae cyanobacterium M33_DOE_097]|uniref:TetR family transcriptional regulator n=1 Tax=Oscillatoriales cyanobacterium SpSt-418 TaxID=2282169 RepID=A0A7C3KDK2_9CYAN|nr:TetR family transcriptional regulator C-terminal domain-containing protein [Leptolyngbyaceae cyanobacterium M33_DOE_097]